MNIKDTHDLCREVAERWRRQYYQEGKWIRPTSESIYNRLMALENPPDDHTPDKIAAIIGNHSWTELICDECEESVNVLVTLGEKEDYDSRTASICPRCLERAIRLASIRHPGPTKRGEKKCR